MTSGATQVKKSKWDDMDNDSTPTHQKTAASSRPSKRSRKAALSGVNVSRSASPYKNTPSKHQSTTTSTTTPLENPPPIQSTSSDASHLNPSYLNGGQQPKKTGISILGRASLSKKSVPPNRSKQIRELHPPIQGCRSVYCYERLNHIEEGSYGVVFRARDKETGEIVALKKIKMDQEKNGFPITSLREIHTLMMARHENIVHVREIVVGDTLTQIFIVMDFIEHDLKTLLSTMRTPFLASEVKTILMQLLSATALCHNNWIIHRDLKTSNLLMNNRGQIKVADFGLARTYGDPPTGDMTQLVVTLWYRAPELLLGAESYTTAIDLWSIGCIFAELILREPLFPGAGEIDQIGKIFKTLGRPTEEIWPGLKLLPNASKFDLNAIQPYSTLRQKFRYVTEAGIDLMNKLLAYDPLQRISADEALKHPYFKRVTIFLSFFSFCSCACALNLLRLLMRSLLPILLTSFLARLHSLNIPMLSSPFPQLLRAKRPNLILPQLPIAMKTKRKTIDMTSSCDPSRMLHGVPTYLLHRILKNFPPLSPILASFNCSPLPTSNTTVIFLKQEILIGQNVPPIFPRS
ncbi:hypothetical protein PGT21_011800 [Puccinia graminis f. sp. tritici]|uniref:cyclin-dependent kinase n=1 Tax=Puccinia graminis f. sp. tritici TaxID=56615 RepID=A0A5B0N5I5_PUCGR|nr:hypothetical protein PGTUg99_018704 [Puccinia graminis f. sp. tritici]KAA1083926.1 hypothetical protein PGT21_011800 [Puccinia graminis f. sp. tritici]